MNSQISFRPSSSRFLHQRGAALVTVVMVSGLMLMASGAVLLSTTLSAASTQDSEAETRAYYAAESGLQTTLNALRGRVAPSPLLASPATNEENKITFRKAVTPATSNNANDTSTTARLSRWLQYNYPTGTGADRVTLGSDTYTPLGGMAYSIRVDDIDNSEIVSYNTTSKINSGTNTITFGSGANKATITFGTATVTSLDAYPAVANQTFSAVTLSATGTGATVPANTRFAIAFNMTAPYVGTATLRGTITAGTITPTSAGTVKLDFDSNLLWLYGGKFNLTSDPLTLNAPNSSGGITTVTGTVTAPEPQRIRVSATGFGPRGARKQIDAILRKNHFNAFTAPATITLVGSSTGFVFDAGSSANETYSGDDVSSTAFIPPIGVTNDTNLAAVTTEITTARPPFNGTVTNPGPQNVANDLPDFLTSTTLCDNLVQAYRSEAIAIGRYYTTASPPSNFGDNAAGQGLTFVDGDLSLNGTGGGILIVTGKLTLHGNFNFHGLILVLGGGNLDRRGGGNGILEGNIIIAPYTPSNLAAGFGAPQYNMSGGGNSTVVFNSDSNASSQNAFSGFIMGVAEK